MVKPRSKGMGEDGTMPILILKSRFYKGLPGEIGRHLFTLLVFPAATLFFQLELLVTRGVWPSPTISMFNLGIGGILSVGAIGLMPWQTVVLCEAEASWSEPLKRRSVDTSAVRRTFTVSYSGKRLHVLVDSMGDDLDFGESISTKEFELAREWIRTLASRRGLKYNDYGEVPKNRAFEIFKEERERACPGST